MQSAAYIQGKFLTKMPAALYRLHGDWCGPITPESGWFKYFFVFVDALDRHTKVSLLTTRNMVFPKSLVMLLRFRNHFIDN